MGCDYSVSLTSVPGTLQQSADENIIKRSKDVQGPGQKAARSGFKLWDPQRQVLPLPCWDPGLLPPGLPLPWHPEASESPHRGSAKGQPERWQFPLPPCRRAAPALGLARELLSQGSPQPDPQAPSDRGWGERAGGPPLPWRLQGASTGCSEGPTCTSRSPGPPLTSAKASLLQEALSEHALARPGPPRFRS